MKKILLFVTITFFLTGCINLNESSYEQIINYALEKESNHLQQISADGYSYYLPKGLNVLEKNDNNIIFATDKYRIRINLAI